MCGPGASPLRITGSPLASAHTHVASSTEHVDVSNPRRHGERGRAKHRHDVQIFRAVLNDNAAARERLGQRRIDDDPRRPARWQRLDGRRPAHLLWLSAHCRVQPSGTRP